MNDLFDGGFAGAAASIADKLSVRELLSMCRCLRASGGGEVQREGVCCGDWLNRDGNSRTAWRIMWVVNQEVPFSTFVTIAWLRARRRRSRQHPRDTRHKSTITTMSVTELT